jgi:hypothetical protein
MVILLIVAVIVLYAGLARFMVRDRDLPGSHSAVTPLRRRPEDSGTPAGSLPAADRDVEQPTWTALDDIQLNRLLEESS